MRGDVDEMELEGTGKFKAIVLARAIDIVRRETDTTLIQIADYFGVSRKSVAEWRRGINPVEPYRFEGMMIELQKYRERISSGDIPSKRRWVRP